MAGPPEDGGGNGNSNGSFSIPLLRPQPKRHWEITPMSTEPPTPRSASTENDGAPVTRSRSILNLTSSTLYGIYGGRQADDSSQPPTPWGAGTMTPASPPESPPNSMSDRALLSMMDPANYRAPPKVIMPQQPLHRPRRLSPMQRLSNVAILSVLGLFYGLALTYLHAYTHVIPVRMSMLDEHTVAHLAFWVLAAVGAGVGLPALDRWWWGANMGVGRSGSSSSASSPRERESVDTIIVIVRCIGGFVGIAFAIRKLPCEASTQAALTLTLSNPILWYLIDGSVTGLLLSSGAGTTGAAVLMGMRPAYEAVISTAAGKTAAATAASAAAAAVTGSYWSAVASKFQQQQQQPSQNATSTLAGPFGVNVAPEVLALAAYAGSALFYCVVGFGNVGRALAYR